MFTLGDFVLEGEKALNERFRPRRTPWNEYIYRKRSDRLPGMMAYWPSYSKGPPEMAQFPMAMHHLGFGI